MSFSDPAVTHAFAPGLARLLPRAVYRSTGGRPIIITARYADDLTRMVTAAGRLGELAAAEEARWPTKEEMLRDLMVGIARPRATGRHFPMPP